MKAVAMPDVYLGRLVKAFGIKGSLKLDPAADFWEGALQSKRLMLRTKTVDGSEERGVVLSSSRPHGNGYVVDVEGVSDRNAAEDLAGSELFIDGGDIDVELPGKTLPYQVIGASVRSTEGKPLGEVADVFFSPAHDVYEVRGKKGTFMVPAVPEFIVSVDAGKREITIRTIPGLVGEEGEEDEE
jgi:16S rRNA processing protein RimM